MTEVKNLKLDQVNRRIAQREIDKSAINLIAMSMNFDPDEFVALMLEKGIIVDPKNAWKYYQEIYCIKGEDAVDY